MSGPRIEVQLAPPGWTHIGGPQLHALVARTEDDELLVAASDAADTGSLAAVVGVLTGGAELGESAAIGSPVVVPDGGGEMTASFVILGWGEFTRVVVRGQGYAIAQVGEQLVRFASSGETLAVTLGPEAEQVNVCAPDERATERFADAAGFDPGRYAALAAAAVASRPSAGSGSGFGAGAASPVVAAAPRVATRPPVPSVIAAPPVWGRAPVVEPAASAALEPARGGPVEPRGPGAGRGFDVSRLPGWGQVAAPVPAPVPAPTVTPTPVTEHTLPDRPAPEAGPGPSTSYDFLLQPERRATRPPTPVPAAQPADPDPDPAGVHGVPAAPVETLVTPPVLPPPAPSPVPSPEPSPPAASPERPGGPRISSVPWRRREPTTPAPVAPPVAAPIAKPVTTATPATTGVRTPPQHAALWGSAASAPVPPAPAPPPPTPAPATPPPSPAPPPLVDRFLGSPTRAADPDPDATIERSQLVGAIGGPSVLAVLCPQGHVGPPHLASCRRCGLEIPPQEPYHTARPALGVLKLSTGDLVTLDRGVLLGRSPRPSDTTPPLLRPHVLKVPSPERDISRNHAEIVLEGWHVLIRDLDSTNGTTITLPGGQPTRLRPNDQQVVEPGTIITLADEVDIVYEVEP